MPTQRFSLLQVKGPDAEKFLQGQVTCDVTQVSTTKGSYGAHCTPKGRVLFSFFIFRRSDDCFWLQVLSSMTEQALKDLKKYAVFFKLELAHIAEQFPIKLIATQNSSIDQASPVRNDIIQSATGAIRQRENHIWEVIGDLDDLPPNTQELTNTDWALLDIRQGIAHVEPDTREVFTPEDLNYPLIDAVSFRKGCYTGQEIVARMHYKGKHKRHTHRFVIGTSEILKPGTTIFKHNTDQKIGELVTAITSGADNQWECLCSIQDEAKDQAAIGENQQKMQWAWLPYAIPEAEQQ